MTFQSSTLLIGICGLAAFLLSAPAQADVTGESCVENGSVIAVNGKRAAGRYEGGTVVRLFGVKAPPLDAVCAIPEDQEWRCGLAAASALLRAVRGRQVECRGNAKDPEGRLMALCFIGERTVNQFMVEMGWAEADRSVTRMFNDVEAQARAAKRGIWNSDYPDERD
jgi:endonuclease YncB( thermonuclease family)